jgi:GT2 family glycosyltransferase
LNSIRLSPLIVADGFAWGWAADSQHRTVTVHLYVDGHQVASECTGVNLPAAVRRQCGKPPALATGFVFALPVSVLDGFPHDLHVAVPIEDNSLQHSAVQTFRSSPVCGEVRQQGRKFTGTVWFDARPSRRKSLLVTGPAGQLLQSIPLQIQRKSDAPGFPAHFSIPTEQLPDSQLLFSCDGQPLRGSPCERRQTLVGSLNKVAGGRITGWAVDAADWQNPLELVLRVDGQAVSWFRPNVRRPDISRYLGLADDSLGLAGFDVPVPELLCDGQPHTLEVVSAADGQLLKNGSQRILLPKPGIAWAELPSKLLPAVKHKTRVQRSPLPPEVSVIILNRNGETVLRAFLESWSRHNTSVPAEVIVVDHASTDGSLALLREWRGRLDMTVLPPDHNGSFSDSCNLGARHARGQHLLFMNNDIVWLQDALPRMLESLQESQVGIVGIKLLKALGTTRSDGQIATEVQHLGIRFKLNDRNYWPFEVQPSAAHAEAEYSPQAVPAVTGAVLLCRKPDFDAAGGFDPAYFYGFEDVELCLRLAHRMQKQVICRNDCVALHHHGYTRLSGREMSIHDRVRSNSAVLESHIGVWIKQAWWRSLVTGDGHVTREALTIGIVVDATPQPRNNTALVQDALSIGQQLREALPHVQLILLPPGRDWKNMENLHVLLVGDLRYDIRSLRNARCDLLTVAWQRGTKPAWAKLPWWNEFGAILAPTRSAAPGAMLADKLTRPHWRLRVVIAARHESLDNAMALQAHLRSEGLPCWVRLPDAGHEWAPMADVCITIGTSVGRVRADVVQVAWRGGAAPMPTAASLTKLMEKRVGRTFCSP